MFALANQTHFALTIESLSSDLQGKKRQKKGTDLINLNKYVPFFPVPFFPCLAERATLM